MQATSSKGEYEVRKLICASAVGAIVACSPAIADVALTGSAGFGVKFTEGSDAAVGHSAKATFTMSGETDTGYSFGATLEFNNQQGVVLNELTSAPGGMLKATPNGTTKTLGQVRLANEVTNVGPAVGKSEYLVWSVEDHTALEAVPAAGTTPARPALVLSEMHLIYGDFRGYSANPPGQQTSPSGGAAHLGGGFGHLKLPTQNSVYAKYGDTYLVGNLTGSARNYVTRFRAFQMMEDGTRLWATDSAGAPHSFFVRESTGPNDRQSIRELDAETAFNWMEEADLPDLTTSVLTPEQAETLAAAFETVSEATPVALKGEVEELKLSDVTYEHIEADTAKISDDATVWISGPVGKISVGNLDAGDVSAGGIDDVGWDGLGVDNIAEALRGGTSPAVRYDHSLGGIGVAATIGDGADAEWAGSISYSADPVTVGLGADSNDTMSVGVGTAIGGVSASALYTQREDDDAIGASISFSTVDHLTITAAYGQNEQAGVSSDGFWTGLVLRSRWRCYACRRCRQH